MRSETISQWLPWALLAAAAAALGTAYTAQLGFGYEPCVLCLYQRVPYAIIAALGVLALYHVGVEQTWWTSAAPCGASGSAVSNTEDFLAALQKKPEKSCGDIDWTLFGISMATYNAVISALLAVLSFLAWRQLTKPKT